jgi:hypothetical protein
MPAMKNILAISALVFAFGCGNKVDKLIGEMEGFKDKMCACKDADCADKVNKEKKEWEKSVADKMTEDDIKKLSDDQKKRGDAADEAYKDCRRKLRDSAKPTGGDTAPATPPATPPTP